MNPVLHDKGVIYVPVPGSRYAAIIAPGSGIVVVPGTPNPIMFYEGNLYDAVNLRDPIERVICAFGRAATQAPTVAMMAVLPCDMTGLIRVGEVHWPNRILWDSDWSERIFREYAGRAKPLPESKRQAVSASAVIEVFAPAFMGDYDVPEEREEWRWIQAEALFEHVGNGVEEGVWEFLLPVRNLQDESEYHSPPPARLAEILAWAREHGYPYILFHQG